MEKYIDAKKLIAEIKRHTKHYESSNRDNFKNGELYICQELLSFIDSLQQEQSKIEEDWIEKRKQECGYRKLSADGSYQCERYKGVLGPCDGRCSWVVDYPKLKGLKEMERPEVDLEKEIEKEWKKCNPIDEGMGVETANIHIEAFDIITRHFFEFGQRKAAEMYDEIEYNRQRSEKEMLGKTRDEAAEEYSKRVSDGHNYRDLTCGFIAGAKWMAEQLEEVLLIMAEKGLIPYKDGNAWSILLGDNLQEGVSGFGDTITEAMMDFLKDAIVQGIVKVTK